MTAMDMTAIRAIAPRSQRGFTAVEMIVVLIVAVSALGLGSTWINNYSDNMLNQSAADHGKTVSDAATRYIKDNNSAILAIATPAVPATITVAMLQGTGYLPSSFTANNPYGQSYSILALEPAVGQLQTLIVTTGGDTIGELNLRRIAQLIGAKGGYVSSTDTTKAQGSYGGWNMPLASYGVTPGAGHVAMALFFQDGALVSDYLYRAAVPGHPELNQMDAPLVMASVQTAGAACTLGSIARDNMGVLLACPTALTWTAVGVSCTAASYAALPAVGNTLGKMCVTTDTRRAFAWNGASWAAIAIDQNGDITVPGKVIGSGSNSTYGALTMQGSKNGYSGINFKDSAGSNAGTLMMHPSYSGFYNAADNNWRWYTDDSGNTQQAGTATMANAVITGTAVAGGACAPNGKVAQDGTGLLLSCQSGVWAKQIPPIPDTLLYEWDQPSGVTTTRYCPAGYMAATASSMSVPSGQQSCGVYIFNNSTTGSAGAAFYGCLVLISGDTAYRTQLGCNKV